MQRYCSNAAGIPFVPYPNSAEAKSKGKVQLDKEREEFSNAALSSDVFRTLPPFLNVDGEWNNATSVMLELLEAKDENGVSLLKEVKEALRIDPELKLVLRTRNAEVQAFCIFRVIFSFLPWKEALVLNLFLSLFFCSTAASCATWAFHRQHRN
jgi:hypothetical protein